MRKFLNVFAILLLAVAIFTGQAYATPTPSIGPYEVKGPVGGQQSDPVKIIVLGRNANRGDSKTGIVSGDVVIYDTVSDDGVTVALTTTSADNATAGIAVTSIDTADATSTSARDDNGRRNWGLYIVHGPALANCTAGGTNAHSAKDPFITSTDSGMVTTLRDINTTPNGTVGQSALKASTATGGFFMEAVTATDSKAKVMVLLE